MVRFVFSGTPDGSESFLLHFAQEEAVKRKTFRLIALLASVPRIHALYYCPQLYRYDGDKRLVPLEGEEIGRLVAKAVQNGVVEKRPWYPPSEMLPRKPVVDGKMDIDFDSMVIDAPVSKAPD